jgi:hypothetical protein
MVVNEDQMRGGLEDRRPEDLARVDDRGRQAALRHLDVAEEPVLAVQQRDPEDLLR